MICWYKKPELLYQVCLFKNTQGVHSTTAPCSLPELAKEPAVLYLDSQLLEKFLHIPRPCSSPAFPHEDPPFNFLLGSKQRTCSWDLKVSSWAMRTKWCWEMWILSALHHCISVGHRQMAAQSPRGPGACWSCMLENCDLSLWGWHWPVCSASLRPSRCNGLLALPWCGPLLRPYFSNH